MTFGFLFSVGLAGAQTSGLANSFPVAFTLDDLGTTSSADVEKTAKALREADVPEAYGFVIGQGTRANPDAAESVRVWKKYGYPIGNHTYSHRGANEVTAEVFEQDILANEPILQEFAPSSPEWKWFRYPHLSEGETLEKRAAIRKFLEDRPAGERYRVAEVTVDFADWLFDTTYGRCRAQGSEAEIAELKSLYLAKATRSLREGRVGAVELFAREIPQITLVHYSAFTAEMMPELLRAYKAMGARFITLAEAEADPVFATAPGKAFPNGENFLTARQLARAQALAVTAAPAPAAARTSALTSILTSVPTPPPAESPWKKRVKSMCLPVKE